MANLVAMLRLPSNLKSTQWQILAGPILILFRLQPERYRPGKGGAGAVAETGANG